MKSVLKRAEEASKIIAHLNFQKIKLTQIKISKDNPDTGHFRLKAFFSEKEFIEIFEFYFAGDLLKYSYAYIMKETSILRYDNAPHHKELNSFPDHKHRKDTIQELEKPSLTEFKKELLELRN